MPRARHRGAWAAATWAGPSLRLSRAAKQALAEALGLNVRVPDDAETIKKACVEVARVLGSHRNIDALLRSWPEDAEHHAGLKAIANRASQLIEALAALENVETHARFVELSRVTPDPLDEQRPDVVEWSAGDERALRQALFRLMFFASRAEQALCHSKGQPGRPPESVRTNTIRRLAAIYDRYAIDPDASERLEFVAAALNAGGIKAPKSTDKLRSLIATWDTL